MSAPTCKTCLYLISRQLYGGGWSYECGRLDNRPGSLGGLAELSNDTLRLGHMACGHWEPREDSDGDGE